MRKLSVGQRKSLAEFFTNGAVAWLSIGIITPFFTSKRLEDFISFGGWGLFFTSIFLLITLLFTKNIKS
jgi:hypothetical protein